MWPNRELLDLIGIDLPIIQAPLAGAVLAMTLNCRGSTADAALHNLPLHPSFSD